MKNSLDFSNLPNVRACALIAVLCCAQFALAASETAHDINEAPYTPRPKGALTFNKDIAPIVFNNCACCHRAGEVAPFALSNFHEVQKRGKQMVIATEDRYMPPWKAEHGFGEFARSRALTSDQIGMLKQWVDEGMAEGSGVAPKLPEVDPSGWKLGKPDMIVTMLHGYNVPAQGHDIYRNFVVPVTVPAGKYVKAIEYHPGNRAVVHHAVLCMMPKSLIQTKFPDKGDGVASGLNPPGEFLPGTLGLWAPGAVPAALPNDLAIAWPATCDMVLQLHLSPSGKPEVEQSSMGFYFSDTPPTRKMRTLIVANNAIDIPAGEKLYKRSQTFTLPMDCEIYGLFAHMHLLGRTCNATAKLPSGEEKPLLKISDWDFRWQTFYEYVAPLKFPKGTVIQAEWTWDNSAENPANPANPPQRVRFGEETKNEMDGVMLEVVPAGPIGKPAANGGKGAQAAGAGDTTNAKQSIKDFDKDGDGKLSEQEFGALLVSKGYPATAAKQLFARFDKDKDGKLNETELAELLLTAGK